jgi:hypothetical protein
MITLEMKREDLKRLQFELEKVQECIVRIAAVHPAHMEELKVKKSNIKRGAIISFANLFIFCAA